jgi:hypothetical protein
VVAGLIAISRGVLSKFSIFLSPTSSGCGKEAADEEKTAKMNHRLTSIAVLRGLAGPVAVWSILLSFRGSDSQSAWTLMYSAGLTHMI